MRASPPDWFSAALAEAPERTFVTSSGVPVEVLRWGKRGDPLLALLHGKEAHAEWWRFIAPFFSQSFRVVAPSWSGMGGSARRARYLMSLFVEDVFAALESEEDGRAILVGHSFGGYVALCAAEARPERFAAVITVDTPLDPEIGWRGPPVRRVADSVYASIEDALARFRFTPADREAPAYIREFIARSSLRKDEDGWRWRFDPTLWHNFAIDLDPSFARQTIPTGMLWGEQSSLMPPALRRHMVDAAPQGFISSGIPQAGHHLMVDQPLAFVAALRTLLASLAGHAPARRTI